MLVAALNDLLRTPEFCRSRDFDALNPQGEAAELAQRSPKEMTDSKLERRNRIYLELACPQHVAKSKKPPDSVERFFEEAVAGYLRSEFPSCAGSSTARPGNPSPRTTTCECGRSPIAIRPA